MQIKLYKLMGVTPSGGHWFIRLEHCEGGIGGDYTSCVLYSKAGDALTSVYSTREEAERALQEYQRYLDSFHHGLPTFTAYGDHRCLRVKCQRYCNESSAEGSL